MTCLQRELGATLGMQLVASCPGTGYAGWAREHAMPGRTRQQTVYRILARCVVLLTLSSCALPPVRTHADPLSNPPHASLTPIELTDAARGRAIPVSLYGYADGNRPRPLAVISHGLGSRSTAYTFLADALVKRGYVVASIQHELPGDEPLAMGEDLFRRRFPNWQAGADTILFVIRALRSRGIAKAREKVVLVGHSNGGDMSMLFASEHPDMTHAVFSLDNRRMPLPRTRHPRICSIRSSDQPADTGVLPTPEEQRALHIRVTTVTDLTHNAMSDWGTAEQKAAMRMQLLQCIGR